MKNFLKKWEYVLIQHQHHWYLSVGIVALGFILTLLRRSDLVLYPQFWAEDGTVWYEDAYNLGGITPFFIPVAGYLQTISRLVALVSQPFPLEYAPLIFNLIAVGIKMVPVCYLFSSRFSKLVPSLWSKLLLAFLYLSLPNTSEVFANITNAQWFLALSAFMILVSDPPVTLTGKIMDTIFLVLSGLSGPFILFLLPFTLFQWKIKKGDRYIKYLAMLIIGLVLIQGSVVLTHSFKARSHAPLEATPAMFVKITAGQAYLSALVGKEGYAYLYNAFLYENRLLSKGIFLAIFLAGSSIMVCAFFKGNKALKLFTIFCLLLFLAALARPMGANWFTLLLPGSATRYWLFPMLAFIVCLVSLLSRQHTLPIRILGGVILLVSVVGMKNEWVYKPWPDLQFKKQVAQFKQVPKGTEFEFKIMPPSWHTMKLIKH